MSDEHATSRHGEASALYDASLRVNTRTLSSGDQDFARMMGFDEDADPPAPATRPAPATVPAAATGAGRPGSPSEDVLAATAPPESVRDWEEIHPRAAALGRQTALLERATRLLTLEPEAPEIRGDAALPMTEASPEASAAECSSTDTGGRRQSEERDARIAELEKQSEQIRSELDAVLIERDRLIDALALANAARAESEARIERLESADRAARDPVAAPSEGERALRAEVTGLRRRLEEASAESHQLHARLDEAATSLAIARAQTEDRLQDLVAQQTRIDTLERERAGDREQLADALARHRELVSQVARLQAENVELRSTQAALEETLGARDLEIHAREEHLQVTRRGLAVRDAQLLEAEARLEQARHERERLEGELERGRRTQAELEARLERREARIATLSTTLARIDEAIGRGATMARMPETTSGGDRTSAAGAQPSVVARKASGADPGTAVAAPRMSNEAEGPVDLRGAVDGAAETSEGDAPAFHRPAILARWRNAQVRAHCGETACAGLVDFLARPLIARGMPTPDAPLRITSLAGESLAIEVELVRALAAHGANSVAVRVVEESEARGAARGRLVAQAGLEGTISIELAGAGVEPRATQPAEALLIVDALWAREGTEALLDRWLAASAADVVVLFADRLAGGPVRLSDVTREKLAELWAVLPESWTDQAGFATPPRTGDDGGTPAWKQDPVTLLTARLRPSATLGFGHVADLFLGASRGAALDASLDAASALLASIDAIDECRAILELLPPRHGAAVLHRRTHAAESAPAMPETFGLAWPKL